MTARYRLSVLSVLLFVAPLVPALPACYTLLQHPRTQQLEYERPTEKRCRGCHSDKQMWSFNHPSARPQSARRYDERWTRYYDVPWWYERYWDYRVPTDSLLAPSLDESTRPTDGRSSATRAVSSVGSRAGHPGAREVQR